MSNNGVTRTAARAVKAGAGANSGWNRDISSQTILM